MARAPKRPAPPQTATLAPGLAVRVAVKRGKVLVIERLINLAGEYGTATAHGVLYRRTPAGLAAHLKFIYGVRDVLVARTTLVP